MFAQDGIAKGYVYISIYTNEPWTYDIGYYCMNEMIFVVVNSERYGGMGGREQGDHSQRPHLFENDGTDTESV